MKSATATVEKHFANPDILLGFMRRTRKPVFHKSNIFFRDIQYAIRDYFDTVERDPVTLPQAERIAREVVEEYSRQGVLRKVEHETYLLDYAKFITPKNGTYSMLTIHGAPLPTEVESELKDLVKGTSADPRFSELVEVGEPELKGGDVSAKGAALAELTLSIVGKGAGEPESGAPEVGHVDPQAATTNKPHPNVERHLDRE